MSQTQPPLRTGLVIGKFMPPHAGHQYLIDFARHAVDRLAIVMDSLENQPISGELRLSWLREMFPQTEVFHLTEMPQDPSEHPEFWNIWRTRLTELLPFSPDDVFASEPYGEKLAEVLSATFVPVNIERSIIPISGTAIRQNPLQYWEYLPRCVRPYFVKRICVFGPESTGKSTLTRQLAEHFQTIAVPEYARTYLEYQQGSVSAADIPCIARGQLASEDALSLNANRLLFCDTDLLLTTIWSDWLFASCPEWIAMEAARRQYDLSLLTDPDVPWVDDIVRYTPEDRTPFFERCEQELKRHGRPYVRISGDWNARFETAINAVQTLLDS